MKIAAFYPRSTYAGWYAVGGYAQALRRAGHDVLDVPLPGNQVSNVEAVRAKLPSIETLNSCDCILSLYHEYAQPWIEAVYDYEAWLRLTPPVIARFDESMDRADLGLPERVPELMRWASYHSFPAIQDAKKFGGQWLPYGADTLMFRPPEREALNAPSSIEGEAKTYDLAFIGSLYPIRAAYLQQLAENLENTITFRCGSVGVQTLDGMKEPESTHLLAEEYGKIKVFFCLPPMSRLVVAKAFDAMACGAFMMYPRLPGDARENLSIFENERHLVYYEPGYLRENGKQIKRWLRDDRERESIASAGCELVRTKYTVDLMLESLLSLVGQQVEVAFA